MNDHLPLPPGAQFILQRLCSLGHAAYVVGGCVRDCLLGRAPQDFDICTSALPEEMQAAFADCHVIETGLKHGTLTVMHNHIPYEVTTFRVDGEYTDHRHPDQVTFVQDITADLARRDFTVNAMAYHPDTGVVDAFGGQEDLRRGVIRCVGEAEKRFEEDALRILRALRFASVYGFTIEEKTAAAAHALRHTLSGVAAERIRAEVTKLLCGSGASKILRAFRDVIFEVLPDLAPMADFPQHNPHHLHDVWEHTLLSIDAVPPVEALRWAMLLHDSGKPAAFFRDDAGVGHFYGHEKISSDIALKAMQAMKMDNATLERVTALVKHHDIPLDTTRKILLRRLNQFGAEMLHQLIDVQCADRIATGTRAPGQPEEEAALLHQALNDLLAQAPCYTLKTLAVDGRMLMAQGFPKGKIIGETLQYLLEKVIDGEAENTAESLLPLAMTRLAKEESSK